MPCAPGSFSSRTRSASSLTPIAQKSAMDRPSTRTARANGFSRVPWQAGHATSRMNPANLVSFRFSFSSSFPASARLRSR